ncbi:MAG: glycosyltransferase [Gammaproteobacteria bacterium]|nr:glycosyltransferase [Gammaproteobacteria bacterium]
MGSLSYVQKSAKPLTVLHIAPTPFFSDRGCHMRIRGIIHALNKRSVSSVLCTYNLGREVEGVETVRTASIPGYTKLEAGPSAFKYLADILLFFKVCGQIYSRKPDIIHAHLHEGALIGWAARQIFFWRKIPIVFDVQGSLVGELDAHGYFQKFKFLKRIFWTVEYLITRMADRFVCSSQNTVYILCNEFNVNVNNAILVNDGADQFHLSNNESLNAALALPENKAIIIYTGALLEAKGLSYLCDTVREAKKRNTACHFLVVGYPEQVMHDFCEKNQLQDMCTLAGRVPYEQLGDYLALADMALEPKLSDSGEASGKLLNYMGASLPVVCFDTTSNRQILGELGYYVLAPEVVEAGVLMDQIEVIITEPEKASERGAAGRMRVNENFSWDAAGEKIHIVYNSCLLG